MWCNFVVILFHSLSRKQNVMNQLYVMDLVGVMDQPEEAQQTTAFLLLSFFVLALMMEARRRQGAPDLSNWVWDDRLNAPILEGAYIGDGAADETISYLKGVLNVGDEADRKFATVTLKGRCDLQSKIFCHTALMGMGKTRLHNELCSPDSEVGKSVVKALEEVGKPVRFIRITYNESSSFADVQGPINKDTFWKHLLYFHGLKGEEAAKVNNAEDAVRHIRDKLGMQADATLVVCVDELMQMPWDGRGDRLKMVGNLMQELLQMQDTVAAPLVFLFSAVTEEMLDAAELASNRRVISAKLPRLSETQLQELLFEEHPRLKGFETSPMFVLLFTLCAPTPRYALEGLPQALMGTDSLETVLPADLFAFLQAVLDRSQSTQYSASHRDLVEDTVRIMLQGGELTESQRTRLTNKGWLCTASNGKPALHPMILRAWATKEGTGDDTSRLPVVLRKMFSFDVHAAESFETSAEEVFMYFEQARRLSFPPNMTTTLAKHYPGGNFHELEGITKDTPLTVPQAEIRAERNFDIVEDCRAALDAGHILVSKKRNEPGVECIFPFHSFDTVLCAGVQVKFARAGTVKRGVGAKIFTNPAMKALGEDNAYTCFGILFSTQQGATKNFHNVCSFNRESLIELMEPKVGPLRVWHEKMPTSGVLASRPVWPATLSLSPTRTSAIRWVPFLRSICKHI